MEARVRLGRDAALGQVRADDVRRALVLLLCAYVYLAALDGDANLRLPAALCGGVLCDGDDGVGLDEEVRAVCERDACAAVLLRLYDVAGEEACVGARQQRLARVGAHDLHPAFERNESRARGRADVIGHALQGVAVQVDVEPGAAREYDETDDDDSEVDEPFLYNPPVDVEATDSGDHE